jgi:hypothetical protein
MSAVGFSLTLAAPCTSQSPAGSSDPHHHAIAVSADAGTIPTVFGGGQCGDDGYNHAPELGLGVSAFARPRPQFFFSAELRASTIANALGCKAFARGPVEVAPGVWENRPGFFASPGTPHSPLVRTLLRAGLETPARAGPIFRASVGGGVIWSSRPAPVAAGSIALSSRADPNSGRILLDKRLWDRRL